MDEARASLSENRRNMALLTEQVQRLQSDVTHCEMRREELETELNNCREVTLITTIN